MKKTLSIIAIAILLTASTAFSQKQVYFGLGGSFLSTWTTNQNNYGLPFEMDYVSTFGGNGNLNIGFDFNNNIGLKLEVGYGVLGQKYKDSHEGSDYTRNVSMNYLQIPLLFKFRTSGDIARFYLMAGPQFNMLLSANQKYNKNGIIDTLTIINPITLQRIKVGEETITDRYTSLDIMGRIDLGVDISLSSRLFLNVGLTMAYGLMDLNATDWRIPDHTYNYNPSHNLYGGINIGLNYLIPL
ncbi:MAG: porin family protein [Bacteroidetes bacterium]|nr:porin family protein [Bacteroidota bacterium]